MPVKTQWHSVQGDLPNGPTKLRDLRWLLINGEGNVGLRACLILGGVVGAVGVAAGALGAHALKARLPAEQLVTYDVAVRYQLVHALALVLAGLVLAACPSTAGRIAAWSWLVGILLFSGCLYGWIFTHWRPLVLLVPVGGVAFVVGWIALAMVGWSVRAH